MANGQFEEGNQAGKGHGRPKGSGHNQKCKEWTHRLGIDRLIEIAEGKHTKYAKSGGRVTVIGFSTDQQLDALKTAIAYGIGKPTNFVDISSGGETFYDFLRGQFPAGGNRVQR